MASASRRTRPSLIQKLQAEASRFEFVQAVRVLERSLAANGRAESAGSASRRRAPVGGDHHPANEVVQFRTVSSLRFPVGPIVRIEPAKAAPTSDLQRDANAGDSGNSDQPRLEMHVSFMGLTGPAGVLPQHYTVRLIRALRNRDLATRDFFDLFNHRLISLFYRAAEKHCFPLGFERTRFGRNGRAADTRSGAEDPVTAALYSLVGLGTSGVRDRMAIGDQSIVHYGGHYSRNSRSAVALELMLQDRFGVKARVLQFRGQWLMLDPADRSEMPSAKHPRGRNNQIGVSMIAGDRVWDVQSRFRVQLGPLNLKQFCRFTRMGDALAPMCAMIRLFVGQEFDFDIQPILKADQVPQSKLGGDAEDSAGARLGWTTWIGSQTRRDDFDGAAFYVSQHDHQFTDRQTA